MATTTATTPLNNTNGKQQASYQSINTTTNGQAANHHAAHGDGTISPSGTPTCGTGVFAPMAYLTRRDRVYRRLVGGLLIVILMVLTGLAYFAMRPEDNDSEAWRGSGGVVVTVTDDDHHGSTVVHNDDDESRKDLIRYRQVEMAEEALRRLNRHTRRQESSFMPTGCETTLMLLRHCEETGADAVDANGNNHCNHVGYERADYIATLFRSSNINNKNNDDDDDDTSNNNNSTPPAPPRRWPTPSYLYALTEIRKHQHRNYREWETLRPLAESASIDIHLIPSDPTVFVQGTYLPMLQAGELCNKLTVVSWKHSKFPALANAVGCGPDQGCPTFLSGDDYDSVWQIKFVFMVDPTAVAATTSTNGTRTMTATSSSFSSSRRKPHKPRWHVYGTVVPQGFDPLAVRADRYNDGVVEVINGSLPLL
jgi:hypothetical protein